MHRRNFTIALALSPLLVRAEENSASRIAILTDLVDAIGAAGEAISKITAGFKDLVIAGKDSYKYVAAERERSRLIDISRRTATLIASQNSSLVASLDEYIAKRVPGEEDWAQVSKNVGITLLAVQELLSDVQNEDGSFVLEPAFLTLNQTLSSRVSLLTRLTGMSAPRTKEERELLRRASANYKALIKNATDAVAQLNAYVKTTK